MIQQGCIVFSGFDFHPAGQGEGDPVRQLITPALGFFVPADQRLVPLIVSSVIREISKTPHSY